MQNNPYLITIDMCMYYINYYNEKLQFQQNHFLSEK